MRHSAHPSSQSPRPGPGSWERCVGIGLAVLVLAAAGCGQTTRLTEKAYPAYPDDHPIEVFTERPTRPYVEVAIVTESSEWTSDRQKLLAALKHRARSVGADAIILASFVSQTTAGPTTAVTNPVTGITTFHSNTSTVNSAEGLAIRWRDTP